jgi:hypothetical protein
MLPIILAGCVLISCGRPTPNQANGVPTDDAAKARYLGMIEAPLKEIPKMATPLNLAALEGRKDVIEWLLAKGIAVNENSNLVTPLHLAALEGHKDVMELLLAKGAEVNARGKYGMTPLQYVNEDTDTAKLLRRHGGHK